MRMNRRLLRYALLCLVCSSMPLSFVSCKDYGDDINNLQGQIDAIRVDLDKFIKLIEGGNVITEVKNTDKGVLFTLSNGESYEITNGKDGENGTPGTAWTIGSDGYWYENGTKTQYRAIGQDGAVGPQGPQGEKGETGATGAQGPQGPAGPQGPQGPAGPAGQNGANGTNGEYYVPNTQTGCFDIYQDGKKIESTNIKWRMEDAVTAVYAGNFVTISCQNEKGEITSQKVLVGNQLGTIAFVPSVLSQVGGYPTTDKPFYHIISYLDNNQYTSGTYKFKPQTNWDRSNEVDLAYRISPQDAYIPTDGIAGAFINRAVTTRAAGDASTLMNIVSFDAAGANASGVLSVKATYNPTQATHSGHDIAAFQLIYGQAPFTTDYIAPSSKGINVEIVNPVASKPNDIKKYYNRDVAIPSANVETSAFIQNNAGVSLSLPANLECVYNGELDLAPLVDLYSPTVNEYITKLDFNRKNISYTFTMPDEYLSNDAQKTNQQWFAQLNGSVIKANTKNLTNGLTPALGRTPVVRVDAFMTPNNGSTPVLVASSYIKVKFVEKASTPGKEVIYDPYYMQVKTYEYHNLTAQGTQIGKMSWQEINNQIYGIASLSSSTFWNYYGGNNNTYEVEISTTLQNGQKKVLNPNNKTASANNTFNLQQDGISCQVTLGSGNTDTSLILFKVDNKVKTQNTYKNVDGKGAEYVITITIKSDNVYSRGNVNVIQKFYVLDECKPYAYNPNYYLASWTNPSDNRSYKDVVITKGTNRSGSWKLNMNVTEAFKMINGQNIFQYYNTINNVTAINFNLASSVSGVTYDSTSHNVALNNEMREAYKVAPMNYDVTLVNGEKCHFTFNIVFQNPFKSASPLKAQTLDGNTIGKVTVNTQPSVSVIDTQSKTIYSYVNNALILSDIAKNTYKLTDSMMTVKYEFKKDSQYNDFYSQLAISEGAVFECNPSTGVVTYDNLGATLVKDYNLTVVATVTIKGISVVTCEIPFLVRK